MDRYHHYSLEDTIAHAREFGRSTGPYEVVLTTLSLVRLGCPVRLSDLIETHSWTVVNAPRPLGATTYYQTLDDRQGVQATWTGPCLHGVFYAAGPAKTLVVPDYKQSKTFEESWQSLDAWPVYRVDQETVKKFLILNRLASEYDYSDDYMQAEGAFAYEATQMGLPWDHSALGIK